MLDPNALYDFLAGAVVAAFVTCALFFWRSWRRTGDELFVIFALAFVLLGAGQAILSLGGIPTEQRAPVYLLRLFAFLLILAAIYRKNRTA
ncbi:MAG: DUF5985 family protein [Sphingomicrobium sp.]